MGTSQNIPLEPRSTSGEKFGLAITAVVLASFALLLNIPFLGFVIFPPPPSPGTENELGAYVLTTIGYMFALIVLVPLIVISAIFSIIATAKSRHRARTIGRIALVLTIVAFALTLFVFSKILLPFWFITVR